MYLQFSLVLTNQGKNRDPDLFGPVLLFSALLEHWRPSTELPHTLFDGVLSSDRTRCSLATVLGVATTHCLLSKSLKSSYSLLSPFMQLELQLKRTSHCSLLLSASLTWCAKLIKLGFHNFFLLPHHDSLRSFEMNNSSKSLKHKYLWFWSNINTFCFYYRYNSVLMIRFGLFIWPVSTYHRDVIDIMSSTNLHIAYLNSHSFILFVDSQFVQHVQCGQSHEHTFERPNTMFGKQK